MNKTGKKYEKTIQGVLKRLPCGLNPLGFEFALILNYGICPSSERLSYLFGLYENVHLGNAAVTRRRRP